MPASLGPPTGSPGLFTNVPASFPARSVPICTGVQPFHFLRREVSVTTRRRLFEFIRPERGLSFNDIVIILVIGVLVYVGARLALRAPAMVQGPTISLEPAVLPWYALRSVIRMLAAYLLSLIFSLVYGYIAAYNRRAERFMMPVLDVLQSVPILSFLPVVLLSLSAVLPERIATELASIVLIFTSQAWNMTFNWYQSLTTIPNELREASAIFRFNGWVRLKTLEFPFGAIGLIWNSMMSWAGGWFFLMAAEIFTVGQRDFRLPGLGAYLQEAANQGNVTAILWGIGTLVLVIVLLDQLVWRPLLVWADKFKLETVESDFPPAHGSMTCSRTPASGSGGVPMSGPPSRKSWMSGWCASGRQNRRRLPAGARAPGWDTSSPASSARRWCTGSSAPARCCSWCRASSGGRLGLGCWQPCSELPFPWSSRWHGPCR
jgi:ABC-type nitrate/sulfonate/bicarbonate transport system permease component